MTPNIRTAPPREWERSINRTPNANVDDPPYGGEMGVAMALDRPLADAQALVRDPHKLVAEILQITRTSNRTQLSKQWLKPMCEMNYI